MRKSDKIKNIIKVNILTEQRFVESNSLTRITENLELKQISKKVYEFLKNAGMNPMLSSKEEHGIGYAHIGAGVKDSNAGITVSNDNIRIDLTGAENVLSDIKNRFQQAFPKLETQSTEPVSANPMGNDPRNPMRVPGKQASNDYRITINAKPKLSRKGQSSLTEQRFVESNSLTRIDEISQGLAARATQSFNDKGLGGDEHQGANDQQGQTLSGYINPALAAEIKKLGFDIKSSGNGIEFMAAVGPAFGGGKAIVTVTKDGFEVLQGGGKILNVRYLANAKNAEIAIQKIQQDFK